jgi:hypothetical protein
VPEGRDLDAPQAGRLLQEISEAQPEEESAATVCLNGESGPKDVITAYSYFGLAAAGWSSKISIEIWRVEPEVNIWYSSR